MSNGAPLVIRCDAEHLPLATCGDHGPFGAAFWRTRRGASRLYYIRFMKTSLLPPVRVSEELRAAAEGVLVEGETLSSFIQQSVERAVEYRRVQADFHSRGQAALERYKSTGRSHAAAEVVAALQAKLDRKRKQLGR